MKLRLASALFISVLLIGGAGWVRASQSLSKKDNSLKNLVSLSGKDTTKSNSDSVQSDNSSNTTQDTGPLSGTDLISHQLLTDYVTLATNGEATNESLQGLADKYVESIQTLNKNRVVSLSDLNPVPNTPENLRNYKKNLDSIEQSYRSKVASLENNSNNLTGLGSELYSLMRSYSALYDDTATKLLALNVPAVIATNHLKLVNNYLSNGGATLALSNTEKDSAFAFAGLVTFNKNLGEEVIILNDIDKILASNGI